MTYRIDFVDGSVCVSGNLLETLQDDPKHVVKTVVIHESSEALKNDVRDICGLPKENKTCNICP